jgi:hypothetical protein
MTMYTVHVSAADLDRPLAARRAVYVREGFNWMAFLFAPLWCTIRRSWLGLLIWCTVIVGFFLLGRYLSISNIAVGAAVLILHVLFGFEAAQLYRRSLTRRGYVTSDVVAADNRRDAELTFDLRRMAAPAAEPVPTASPARTRTLPASDSYGLAPLGGGA